MDQHIPTHTLHYLYRRHSKATQEYCPRNPNRQEHHQLFLMYLQNTYQTHYSAHKCTFYISHYSPYQYDLVLEVYHQDPHQQLLLLLLHTIQQKVIKQNTQGDYPHRHRHHHRYHLIQYITIHINYFLYLLLKRFLHLNNLSLMV